MLRPSTKFEVRRPSRSEDTAHLVCQLSIYNSFPVIGTTVANRSSFLRTPAFIFCLPWGRPCGNHAKRCMNEKTIQCLPNPLQHLPIYIYNSFPVIRTASAKNRRFHVPQPTVCFPWIRPCDYHAICCINGKTIQCLPNLRSMYPYIFNFNHFRVIQCLSRCVSPNIAIFTTFLFPLGKPLGQSR